MAVCGVRASTHGGLRSRDAEVRKSPELQCQRPGRFGGVWSFEVRGWTEFFQSLEQASKSQMRIIWGSLCVVLAQLFCVEMCGRLQAFRLCVPAGLLGEWSQGCARLSRGATRAHAVIGSVDKSRVGGEDRLP